MTLTADQIPGNRFKLEQPVTVHIGSPGSVVTDVWETGFVTPQVYSWVERNGEVWWQIGELPPIRYIRHDPDALEVVADSGGAQFLESPEPQGTFSLDNVSGIFDAFTLDNFAGVLKVALYAIAFFISWKIYGVLHK